MAWNEYGGSNSEYQWRKFTTEAYVNHNYARPLKTDLQIADKVIGRLASLGRFGKAKAGRDVGTGGVLRHAAIVGPLIADDGRFEFTDVGDSQPQQTEAARAAAAKDDLGIWGAHEASMADRDKRWRGATQRVCAMGSVAVLNVFDLSPASTEISTAAHALESLTGKRPEFEQAFGMWTESVTSGGLLAMFYMIGSNGYRVDGVPFPAVSIDPDDIDKLADLHNLTVVGGQIAVPKDQQKSVRKPGDPTDYRGFGAAVMLKP